MRDAHPVERVETLIIGGGQAGLATGYHLARRDSPFLIVDARDRVGDVWRDRWDSLRLFTPARFDGLPGLSFPAPPHSFPTKDEMAAYLEAYADAFALPVRTGVRVDALVRRDGGFEARAGAHRFHADQVVVAMANYQKPWTPAFAERIDPSIVQLHSADYRNPAQLRPGRVLLVGGGNSGSEIAMELAGRHSVVMSGRDTGQLPFRPRSRWGRVLVPVVLRLLFYRVLTVGNPVGRAVRSRILGTGGPLIRVKRRDLAAARIQRVGRTIGVRAGLPELADGRVLKVENVVWCTGFRPGFEDWIDLPIHGDHEPVHHRGTAVGQPGLYFVGLHFQRAMSSAMIHGVGRDAAEVADRIEERRCGPALAPMADRDEHAHQDITEEPSMSKRQLSDQHGHRWDVEDEGPLTDRGQSEEDAEHQLRFTRDDGSERVRTAPRNLNQLADVELRTLLEAGDLGEVERGPDTEANRSGGYGDAGD